MLMAHAVTQLASRTPGKEAVAMESYAKALRMLPTIIADNAGYDSADLVAQLRAAHSEGKTTAGLGKKVIGILWEFLRVALYQVLFFNVNFHNNHVKDSYDPCLHNHYVVI